MITSIFSKSKPINLIIVFFITLIAFYAVGIDKQIDTYSSFVAPIQIALFFVCYGSILLLNFIVSKNSLSKDTNLEILLYSLFLLAFFQSTQNLYPLISNFFVLLALRRILSIRSQINLVKKFFDAAFWITVAAHFYFWSILFFIIIIASLIIYANKKITHWLVPFMGFLTVILISMSISLITYNTFFGLFYSIPEISFDYTFYNTVSYLVSITMLLSFGAWSTIFYLNNIKQKKKNLRASFSIIFLTTIIAFFIIVLAPNKNGSEFLFMFAPLSIIIVNYIEIVEEKWFKELFLSVMIIVPLTLLVLKLNGLIN